MVTSPKGIGSHNLPSAAQHEEDSPHCPHPSPSHTSHTTAIAVDQVGLKTGDLADVTGEATMDDQSGTQSNGERYPWSHSAASAEGQEMKEVGDSL